MDVIWGVSVTEVAWGGMIAIYLFLAGIAGGAFLTASLTDLFSKNKETKVIRSGITIAVVTIIIGLGLLVVDLGRPLSFWKLILNVNLGSVMSIGVFIVSGFTGLSVVYGYLVWSAAAAQRQIHVTSENTEVAATSVVRVQGIQTFRKPVGSLGGSILCCDGDLYGFLIIGSYNQ